MNDAVADGVNDGAGAVVDAELLDNALDVSLHGLLSNSQVGGEGGETLSIIGVSANVSLGGGFATYTATDLINVALSNGAGNFSHVFLNMLGDGDAELAYLGIPGTNYTLEIRMT